MKTILIALITVLLAAGLVYMVSKRDQPLSTHDITSLQTEIDPTPTDTTQEASSDGADVMQVNSKTDSGKKFADPTQLARAYTEAKTAGEAQLAIEAAENLDFPVALDWQMHLDSSCLAYHNGEFLDSEKWHAKRYVEFCSDHEGISTPEEWVKKYMLAPTYVNVNSEAISQELLSLPTEERTAYIHDLIRNAQYPEDISALIDTLGSAKQDHGFLWDEGGYLEREDGHNYDDYFRSQSLALQLYKCQRYGGCGPTGSVTLDMCLGIISDCQPGWAFQDAARYFYNARDYDAALRLLDKIANL